ncbi:MAG: DMT family transporter [Alphaproteobacteria bacterium]|nr:DMT family transporter [Alphaproteobacteria bacterium]
MAEPARAGATSGVALVLGAAIAFSFKGILAKLLYAEGVSVPTLLALRFAVGLPLVWLIARRTAPSRRPPTGAELAAVAIGGVLGFGLAPITDFIALALIDVSIERVILFSFPAFVLLFDSVRRRALPGARQWLALGLTQAGVVLTMGGFDLAKVMANLEGSLWAIASAAFYAVYLMVNQAHGRTLGAARFTALGMTAGTATVAVYFLALKPIAALNVSLVAWAYVVAIAVFCTVVPMIMFTEGIKRIGAARASLVATIGPPWTVALAALVLGETFTVQQAAGGALVILGVLALEGRLAWLTGRSDR